MKKLLIGALVGGLLVFIWQTLSWTVLNLHAKSYQYTTSQDSILSNLSSHFSEDGQYLLPNLPRESSMDDMTKFGEANKGKPWAIVSYHKSYDMNMGANIVRGLLTQILAVFLLCWILVKIPNAGLSTIILSSIFVGLIGFMFIPYSEYIWYKFPGAAINLLDAVLSWGLCGVWLGWWLRRNP